MSRDRKLSQLDSPTKTLIEETLSQRADGMFRWVYCQLQALKEFKSTRPKPIKAALLTLPRNLDETYERMLSNINEDDRPYALTFLRWLAYAKSPPSLGELAEASIVDPTDDENADGFVDVDYRGGWVDILEILASLVVVRSTDKGNIDDEYAEPGLLDGSRGALLLPPVRRRINKDGKIRLAHFSVKEYLESSRILASDAKMFHLDSDKEHRFLTQSCLVYLAHYSSSSRRTSTTQDLTKFPLLTYAARTWYHHTLLQQHGGSTRELSLLSSENRKRDWILVYNPDRSWGDLFGAVQENAGSALYYASLLGLEAVVQGLLSAGADVNAQGGRRGDARRAAASGARFGGNALHAASSEGHKKVVQMLINVGVDVSAHVRYLGNALQVVSQRGHEKVVQMLIDAGADVNAQGGRHGNALQVASWKGQEKVVQMLLDAEADVKAEGGEGGNALHAASEGGREKVVQMLLDAGADVKAKGGKYGNAVQAASQRGHKRMVKMLLDVGADVNAQGGQFGNALQAALSGGHEKVVQILMDAEAVY